MSEYDHLSEAIPAELMAGEEETPPEPPSPQSPQAAVDKEPLPPDVEAVWGEGKVDAEGLPTADFARQMIAAWGLDAFRASAIHTSAIKAQEREAKMEPIRAAFIKAKKAKT